MRTLILVLTLIVALPQIASAQKLQKAFAMVYGGGDTLKAKKIFKKSVKKHRDVHAAYYGLGLCYTQSNPKEAFVNFRKVDGKFRNSAKDFRKMMLSKYGITQDSAKIRMDEIAAVQLRRTIMNDSTEKGFGRYVGAYKGCNPKFINRALVLKEDAAYREARKDKSMKKAKQFIATYPHSRRINYMMEFIDSLEYFKRLDNGTRTTLFKYMVDYEKGRLFSLRSAGIQGRSSLKKAYYGQASRLYGYLERSERLTGDFISNWCREVYYSGHWKRLRFLYDRLPHVMVDTLRQMFYAGVYAEDYFAMAEIQEQYGDAPEDFYRKKDSIYDFYIRRGAPSRLAMRRMQALYKYFMSNGQLDSTLAVIERYEALFPYFKGEIEQLKRLITENKDSCRPIRLPVVINEPSVQKPDIRYYNVRGKKIPYIANFISFGRARLFDAVNKYPVISPDGTRLYLTHWEYKPIKLQKKFEYVHLKTQKRIVDEYITTDTVKAGIGICYSDFKNGRWQPLQKIEGLYLLDSIWIDTVESPNVRVAPLNDRKKVPEKIALKFFNDKDIKANRYDSVGIYYVGEEAHSIDKRTTFTSGISADNNVMYVIRPEKMQWGSPKPPLLPEFYCSKVIDVCTNRGIDKWSKPIVCGKVNHYLELDPEQMPHPYFGSMNAHPSPDNNTLFFAAGRRGVPGWREDFTVTSYQTWWGPEISTDTYLNPFICNIVKQPTYYPDLWFSTRDENGMMGYPINLGPDVNTEYAEYSPVLAADNKTLYFVSNGRTGIGGTDIYMCKRRYPNSWTDWTVPVNLGKYINTPYDEQDFSITADGKTAYYTSEEPLTHRQIVYKVELPMMFRPDTIAIYKGKITNLSGEPTNANIRVIDDLNKVTYAQYRTQPNGEFYFGLPQDRPYRFVITAKNAASATDTLGCETQKSIVKKHDFVLADSADVFEKRLPIPYDVEGGVDVVSFLKQYDVPALEITVYEPYKSAAEITAEDLKKRFLPIVEDQEERITTVIKTGKKKVEVRVIDVVDE